MTVCTAAPTLPKRRRSPPVLSHNGASTRRSLRARTSADMTSNIALLAVGGILGLALLARALGQIALLLQEDNHLAQGGQVQRLRRLWEMQRGPPTALSPFFAPGTAGADTTGSLAGCYSLCPPPKAVALSVRGACSWRRSNATLHGQPVTGFDSDEVRAYRQSLNGMFWSGQPRYMARHSLSQAPSNLRRLIDDDRTAPPHLETTRQALQCEVSSDARLDVAAFADLIQACQRHAHARLAPCDPCLAHLERAVASSTRCWWRWRLRPR